MAAETVLVDGIEKKIVRIIPYRGIKLKKGASGSSIAKADDIHRQIHFENSAGGIAYLITLSQPGGHDMPWNAGETSKKKASGRLSQPDKLLIFNELHNDAACRGHGQSSINVFVLDCNDLSKAERLTLETHLARYTKKRNSKAFNTQKTGAEYAFVPEPNIAILGVTAGPLKCSATHGTKAEKELGKQFMRALGIK